MKSVTSLEHELHTLREQNTYQDCSHEIEKLKRKIAHAKKRKGQLNRKGKIGRRK